MTTYRHKCLGLSTLVLGGAMGATAVFAQSPAASPDAAPAATQSASSAADPNDATTYATGKPLAGQSKEGFWGHLNPFARKKWVQREVDPIRDRTNELDQLQAKNANDIKDVDRRSQAGINQAMMAANSADQHAADAANRANAAQGLASTADSRTTTLNGTVSNLDQYSQVTSVDVPFAAGRTALGPKGKSDLDGLANQLTNEKGYIIEVQGYSRGVQTSQAMADSVARYLVVDKQVPLYRIYRTGLGKEAAQPANGESKIVNGVRVTLLHNSLASMNQPDAASSSTPAAPSNRMGQSQPLQESVR